MRHASGAPAAPLARLRYRFWQAWHRLMARVAPEDLAPVHDLLPPAGQMLFATMSRGDQRHSLDVFHALAATGCADRDLLAAALLHDSGKGAGRVRFVMRPTIVILKAVAPRTLRHLAGPGALADVPRWRRPFRDAWHHAELGAILAQQAGLPPRVVTFIRTHHDPNGPAAALHAVDEEN
jgi:putative nucleotidyltransferase with HDIG domain